MAVSESLVALLQEQLEPLGRITFRRMFSGAGVYCDGVIFALVLRDALHFKVDDGNRAAYEVEGMEPFSYEAQGKIRQIGAYWRVPERLFRWSNWTVTQASHTYTKRDSATIEFRVPVAAGEEAVITYTVRYSW